ncbi:hypothetical protein [Providencia sp. NPDC089923]|uniref:hypothetical protein n=1 Tax=Providencia sp. NPDC089923 TaxID=3415004 RepID=UPI003C30EA09
MTLIVKYNVGGVLSIIASDTRQQYVLPIMRKFTPRTSHEKIKILSDNLLCAGGGLNNVFKLVIDYIEENKIKSVLEVFTQIWEIDRLIQKRFEKFFKMGEVTQLFFSGIDADGVTRELIYLPAEKKSNKIRYSSLTTGEISIGTAAPKGFLDDGWFHKALINQGNLLNS